MPDELIPQQNTGVLVGQRPTDFIAGVLPFVERTNGDWRPFLVKEEKQFQDNVDTMACVSFSANNSLEIQLKQQLGVEVNFSDRFLAKISGTTQEGNYLYKVADALRNIGIVFESEYPSPTPFTWDSYYASIPEDVMKKVMKPDIAYEWVNRADFEHHLKHAPLQIIIPDPIPNHAVVLVAIEGDTAYYFDTYPNHLKTINVSRIYPNALKIVLNAEPMPKYYKVNDHGKLGIMILEGFSGTILFENDFAEYQSLLKITGIDDNTPTINIP